MDALCSISRRGAPAQLAPLLQMDRIREEIDR